MRARRPLGYVGGYHSSDTLLVAQYSQRIEVKVFE